jgi:preprotein translocase subunit SecF
MVSKAVSLVAALVSIITLENAMITVFGGENQKGFSKIMTAATGAGICAAVVAIAVYIIVIANKYLQNTDKIEENKDCPENKVFEKD